MLVCPPHLDLRARKAVDQRAPAVFGLHEHLKQSFYHLQVPDETTFVLDALRKRAAQDTASRHNRTAGGIRQRTN